MRKMLLLVFILIVAGCQSNQRIQEEVQHSAHVNQNQDVLATNLNVPWAIEKQGEIFYITERNGSIVKVENGQVIRMNVSLQKDIHQIGEGGLLGFLLDPDFQTSNQAILYHTYSEDGEVKNRLVQVELVQNEWKEQDVLLEGIPGAQYHNGGRIELGPDEKLYVTTGDALVPENAQSLDSLSGKILRMNLDGTIPSDNPFKDSYVYSYGHRNPQGLAWSEDGKHMFSSEHGPDAHDEINKIGKGKNYGWPIIVGDETQSGMEAPFLQSGNTTWAPAGMEFRDEKLYVTSLRGGKLFTVDVSNKEMETLVDHIGRIRDVLIEGDHYYFVTSNRDGRGNPASSDDRLIREDSMTRKQEM